MKIDPRDEADRGPPTFEEAFCELFEQQFPSLFRYLNRLTGDADLADDLAQEVFVRLYQRGTLPDDSRGWMGEIRHRVLILHGAEDRLVRLDHAKALCEAMPAAQLAVIEGAPHFLNWECADAFNYAIGDFLG